MFNGNKIFELTASKRMKMEDLADLAGISRSHLSRIANNKRPPSLKTLSKIAKALEVKEDFFYNDNIILGDDKKCYYELADKLYDGKVPIELIKSVVEGWQKSQKE